MKFKSLLIIFLLCTVVFSAVSFSECHKEAFQYVKVYEGETMTNLPNILNYKGAISYWVFEVKSNTAQIQFMIPVNSETGSIDYSSNSKDIIKTHYLSNFFDTDDSIAGYLSSQLTYAEIKEDTYSNAKTDLLFYEIQLGNFTVGNLTSLKNELEEGVDIASNLQTAILDTKSKIVEIKYYTQISSIDNSFDTFFLNQSSFLTQAEIISATSSALLIELADNEELITEKPQILQALQGVVNSYNLKQSVTSQKNDLKQNQDVIDGFFNGMDNKVDQFHINLVDRIEGTSDVQIIKNIITVLKNYSDIYIGFGNEINTKNIPNSYDGIEENMVGLFDLIEESKDFCKEEVLEDCKQARDNYEKIDTLVYSINNSINSYSTSCTTGQNKDCMIAGESGTQTCLNGIWCSCVVSSSGYNMTLIIVLVVVILGLIVFKFKDDIMEKIGSAGEPAQEETSSWQSQWKK